MVILKEEKQVNDERTKTTCEFFDHKLRPHVHYCTNADNVTGRCGYEIEDWQKCPIKGLPVPVVVALDELG